MKNKRFTLVQQVLFILLIGFTVVFAAGVSVMQGFRQSSLQFMYGQTQELVRSCVNDAEDRLSKIGANLYDLIVSDTIQKAGSEYLSLQNQKNSLSAQAACLDTITAEIQKSIIQNDWITCANYLDAAGGVRAVASTGYTKLSQEAARAVEQLATQARGKTILIDASESLLKPGTLLFARELREKKGLSLRHIGVIVLVVDMEKAGAMLADAYDGAYLLQNEDYGLSYLFNDSSGIARMEAEFSDANIQRNGYALLEVDGSYYFVTEFADAGHLFSYRVLLPYGTLFAKVEGLFTRFVGIFILCCAAALALSIVLMRRVTLDIRRLRTHIGNISNFADIPINGNLPMHNRDSYELYQTFNAMAEYINTLIRDNYQKQILVKETQLSTLQAQINPHFLYNTLNSIYWMAKKANDPHLSDMIDSLSRLLREATNVNETLINIDKELDIVCHYARIQQQRYGERLNLTFDVSEECGGLAIPKFTLQPMLENAIHYGLEQMLEACDVSIRIITQGEACMCQVRNKGPAPAEDLMEKLRRGEIALKGNGVGLLNIDKRIKTVFGESYGICVFRDLETEETVVQAVFRKKPLAEWEAREHAGNV